MDEHLRELQGILIQGQRLSGQGTYQRRAPAKKAIPFLNKALVGLRSYVANHRDDVVGWRLLSLAEECLLNYTAARLALEKVIAMSPGKERRDLIRLPKLREGEERARDLKLGPALLEELRSYLNRQLSQLPCDHSLRHTRNWLIEQRADDLDGILEAFAGYGGYCDCEVALNVL